MNAKLTAYALNELPPDERAAVEAEMETNPALRAEAEEMRKFCAMLHDEVSDADKTTLTSEQRFRVLREFSADTQPQPKKSERSIWRHPAFWVPTAIAACTTAMLVINLKEQHAPTAMEHEALVASTKGKNSTEDVRVNFEKAKPVAMSQTPAPGKPETPPLVASNSLTVRGGNMEGLPPMPTPSTPTSTIRLQPTGTPEAQPALELRAGSLVADLGTDFSSASENGRIAGTLEQANRGVQIGASRPPEHFRFSYDQMNETPANPVPAPMDLNGSLTAVDRTPIAPGNAGDLFFSQTVGGVPMAPSSPSYAWTDVNEPAVTLPDGTITLSDSNTYTGGVTLSSGGLVKGTGNANGTIHANGGGVIATGGMTVTAGNSVTLPSETANVSGVQSFGRNVSGTGAVAKTGAGTLTITNGSSYTGSSYISAGELVTEFSDTAGASGPPANMTLAGAPSSPGAAPATSQPTSSLSASTGLAADGPRAKMLNEVNSDWETPVAPAMAATGSTAATPTSGKAGWRMDSGPPTDPNAQHDVSAPILAATPNAKRLSSASSMTPAGQPMDALSLADASTADAAMKTASGGALGAPGASTATPARPASTTPGMPAGVQPLAPGTSTGVFGAGVLPADPMTASAATPLPALNNPAPADKTRLYAITDGDSDAYRRSTATTTTRTTETLVREKKKEQEVEKLEKDLKQLGDIQEAEVRARKLVARHANGETYTPIYENPFLQVAQQPLSTFSIDVDTASYANVRRFLNNGQRPPADAVRLEELINYFPYSYESPAEDGAPFSVTVDMAEAPWQPMHRLARIALKGREIRKERGAANFVFLVDVSGSMDQPDKLPLVKQSLRMLTEQLKDTDRVAIVTYAGDTGVALTSTPGSERQKIQSAIEALTPGGSTNGAGGIRAAYQQASQNFIQEGVNRVILCTDGDFNVGISSPEELEKLIAEKAKSRVFLSVLGYGTGNLKDRTMETLADKGNGNYAYIDSLSEARKVLVDQINATLVTIAKDVKIQVEFNPAQVASYRLLGYENRALAKEDFNNDRKDAGEIGAGHTVTALYEIVPVGARAPSPDGRPAVDDLKYAPKPAESVVSKPPGPVTATPSRETMTVKLRYKQPTGDKSDLIEVPVTDKEQTMANAPRDFVFAASVTGFGMMLRNSKYAGELTWDMVRDMALRGKGEDPLGYRGEFLQLIDKARGLTEGRE